MAMVVKNNISANNTLNKLDKNSKALAKSLQKVSSGMKINSAADDASGFSISEKMRVQIRALDQANSNAQNAGSLLKTAEGAASSTVDILRTLKAKAIDAANDTNTDTDRAIIQKELDQSIDQISDNANVTFNGKKLFDGSADISNSVQDTIIKALNSEWLKASFDMVSEAYGLNFTDGMASVTEMDVVCKEVTDPSLATALAYVTVTSDSVSGKATALSLTVNMKYYNYMNEKDPNGSSFSSGSQYLDRTIAHELTHAVMASNIKHFRDLPLFVIEGFAEVTHGIDDNRTSALEHLGALSMGASGDDAYAGGYAFLRYMNKQCGGNSVKNFVQGLVQYGGNNVDKAVNFATSGRFSTLNDMVNDFNSAKAAAANTRSFLLNSCGIDLDNPDKGSILGSDAGHGEVRDDKDTVLEGLNTKFWYYPNAKETLINGLTVKWPDFQKGSGLKFQVGTKANMVINSAFGNISAEGLGLRSDAGNTLSVGNRVRAKQAITILDNAIDKVLDQQTNIGALESRMGYTQANLTTASENTVAAESVIRDADMAKEMTEYTKNNVLLQASQSMLAQANQNSSSVLSLLQ